MSGIPEFGDAELWVIKSALKERYGKDLEVELADSELRLHPDDRELTLCPTVFWQERGASFVLCKVAENRYRSLFFYLPGNSMAPGARSTTIWPTACSPCCACRPTMKPSAPLPGVNPLGASRAPPEFVGNPGRWVRRSGSGFI